MTDERKQKIVDSYLDEAIDLSDKLRAIHAALFENIKADGGLIQDEYRDGLAYTIQRTREIFEILAERNHSDYK